MTASPAPNALLVMGVCGVGKTTLGGHLAEELGWEYVEGDDLHPEANRRKMAGGTPLNDEDRRPWLAAVRNAIEYRLSTHRPVVVSCSALKSSYRRWLRLPRPEVGLIHLTGDPELIASRIEARSGHFMPASLLASQLATLDAPSTEEALILDASRPLAELGRRTREHFAL